MDSWHSADSRSQYASVAVHASWGPSLLAGWACAIALGIPLTLVGPAAGLLAGLAAATFSLSLAYCAMPRSHNIGLLGSGTDLVRVRIATTAALIVVLTSAAELLGATVGGVLTALPLLASVLASFTHRGHGPDAALALLRGMLAGMAGFVAFCAVVAALLVPDGAAAAFGTATLAAVAIQTLTLVRPWRARKHDERHGADGNVTVRPPSADAYSASIVRAWPTASSRPSSAGASPRIAADMFSASS